MRRPRSPRPHPTDFLSVSPDPATPIMPSAFPQNRAARFLRELREAFRWPAFHDVRPVARLPLARQTLRRGVSTAFPCAVPETPYLAAFVTATREPLVEDRVAPWITQAAAPLTVGVHSRFLSAFAVTPVQDRIPSRFCGNGLCRPLRLPGPAQPTDRGALPRRVDESA